MASKDTGMTSSFPQGNEPTPQADAVPQIDTGKRVVALVIDIAASYLLGIVMSLIPFISQFLPAQAVMIVFLLVRDSLFDGRGVGKNLMGLRVIDAASGRSPTILQSVQRNIIFFAPYVVLYMMGIVLRFVPIPWLNEKILDLVNLVGMAYVGIVIPIEGWRVWHSEDGQRIGDEIAGTKLVESNMDFSNAMPR
ncbi:MAG: RDD family protein [Candidatus Obscuribacterales bacterium]|nr:RDD family protein [Candidatus Obscuribacterales bacterium]